jgi:anti-sigma regulatory factor (Ser/Thr protein kinase)
VPYHGCRPLRAALSRSFPAIPEAAPHARRALAALPLPQETRQKLALLVCELVTNSVRHGGPDDPIHLLVTHGAGEVRVVVHDSGAGFAPDRVGPGKNEGLGLVIVDGLSNAWGVESDGAGCTVWCTLDVQERD